jgi:hypothetical protein
MRCPTLTQHVNGEFLKMERTAPSFNTMKIANSMLFAKSMLVVLGSKKVSILPHKPQLFHLLGIPQRIEKLYQST